MATKKNATKKEEAKKEFEEFKYSGKKFEYSGRLFPKKEGKGKVLSKAYVTLTLNEVITISGVWLYETESSYFLKFPEYKSGDSWKTYIFIDKEMNDEIDALTDVIASKLE